MLHLHFYLGIASIAGKILDIVCQVKEGLIVGYFLTTQQSTMTHSRVHLLSSKCIYIKQRKAIEKSEQ